MPNYSMQGGFDFMPSNGWNPELVSTLGGDPTYDQMHRQAPYPNFGDFDYNVAADGVAHNKHSGIGLNNNDGHSDFINSFPSTPPATSKRLKRPAELAADDEYTPSRKPTQAHSHPAAAASPDLPVFEPFYSVHQPPTHQPKSECSADPPYPATVGAPQSVIRDVDNDSQIIWTNRFQTAEDAANHLAALEEPLQLPELPNDDAYFYQFFFLQEEGKAAFNVLTHRYGPPPKDWDIIKCVYYAKQQDAVLEKIVDMLSTPQGRKTAEARMIMAMQAGIDAHLVGMPASHFGKRKRGAGRTGYKSDVSLICSQRLLAMRHGIEQNKLIAWDVLNGQGLVDFARNPALYLERKYINVKSNGNKKEGQQMFNKMKKEIVAEPNGRSGQLVDTKWSAPPSPDTRPMKKQRRGGLAPENERTADPMANDSHGHLTIRERY